MDPSMLCLLQCAPCILQGTTLANRPGALLEKAESAPAVGPGLRAKGSACGQQGHTHSTHFPSSACSHTHHVHTQEALEKG